MSLARSLLQSLRWALLPLLLTAVSIALQYGMPAQAHEFLRVVARYIPDSILHPSSNDRNDAAIDATIDAGGVIGPESLDHWSFDIIPWHPRMIDYIDFVKVATIQEGRLEVVRHPDLGNKHVLVKRAALPEYFESISRETEFYRLLAGLGVTPEFLGHVTERDRVTGFIAEYVEQQEDGERHGWDNGTESCLSALRRIHGRGIAHRDAHGGNCLVRGDGSAALVDFELAEETTSVMELERDMWVMRHSRHVEE